MSQASLSSIDSHQKGVFSDAGNGAAVAAALQGDAYTHRKAADKDSDKPRFDPFRAKRKVVEFRPVLLSQLDSPTIEDSATKPWDLESGGNHKEIKGNPSEGPVNAPAKDTIKTGHVPRVDNRVPVPVTENGTGEATHVKSIPHRGGSLLAVSEPKERGRHLLPYSRCTSSPLPRPPPRRKTKGIKSLSQTGGGSSGDPLPLPTVTPPLSYQLHPHPEQDQFTTVAAVSENKDQGPISRTTLADSSTKRNNHHDLSAVCQNVGVTVRGRKNTEEDVNGGGGIAGGGIDGGIAGIITAADKTSTELVSLPGSDVTQRTDTDTDTDVASSLIDKTTSGQSPNNARCNNTTTTTPDDPTISQAGSVNMCTQVASDSMGDLGNGSEYLTPVGQKPDSKAHGVEDLSAVGPASPVDSDCTKLEGEMRDSQVKPHHGSSSSSSSSAAASGQIANDLPDTTDTDQGNDSRELPEEQSNPIACVLAKDLSEDVENDIDFIDSEEDSLEGDESSDLEDQVSPGDPEVPQIQGDSSSDHKGNSGGYGSSAKDIPSRQGAPIPPPRQHGAVVDRNRAPIVGNELSALSARSVPGVRSSVPQSIPSSTANGTVHPVPSSLPVHKHLEEERRGEVANLKGEVQLLRKELSRYRETIAKMQEREKLMKDRLSEQAMKQLEKGSTKFEDLNLGDNRPTQLIRRYGNCYSQSRLDAFDALDDLPEIAEFDDLKGKLLFSVVVLAFRAAQRGLEDVNTRVRQLLSVPTPEARRSFLSDPLSQELVDNIAAYLRKTIDKYDISKLVEEVSAQVFATLFDYPSLKECGGLLGYIEECVRIAWGLSVQNPPLVIDFEPRPFTEDMHQRFHTSDPDSNQVQSVLWPTLLEGENGPCVFKGVVIT